MVYWLDIADHPIYRGKTIPAPAAELIKATGQRMKTYREYGFVSEDSCYPKHGLGLGFGSGKLGDPAILENEVKLAKRRFPS